MRLLATQGDDPKLEFVNGEDVSYAILSHRWLADDDEVTYDDVRNGRGRAKKGWEKLMACRRQAVLDGFDYIWMDTCCIDKSSSQELTESINAMFKWYRGARICYVYLHDMPDPLPFAHLHDAVIVDGSMSSITTPASSIVDSHQEAVQEDDVLAGDVEKGLSMAGEAQPSRICVGAERPSTLPTHWSLEAFYVCEWFTRSWTLQEMLASSKVVFFSQSWTLISTLHDLVDDVAKITNVHREALTSERPIESYSIAQRMSWAASRRVTRIEDRAYSLLGIMDVSLPIVYGEGNRAFQRLQEEILQRSSDDSIFVFQQEGKEPSIQPYRRNEWPYASYPPIDLRLLRSAQFARYFGAPLLAESPDAFRESRNIIRLGERPTAYNQVMAKEVRFSTVLLDHNWTSWWSLHMRNESHPRSEVQILAYAVLCCCREDDMSSIITPRLCSLPGSLDRFFVRADSSRHQTINMFEMSWGLNAKVQRKSFNVIRGYHSSTTNEVIYTTLVFKPTASNIAIEPVSFPKASIWSKGTLDLGVLRQTDMGAFQETSASFAISIAQSSAVYLVIRIGSKREDIRILFKDCCSLLPDPIYHGGERLTSIAAARLVKERPGTHWFQQRVLIIKGRRPNPALGYRDATAMAVSSHHLVVGICLVTLAWVRVAVRYSCLFVLQSAVLPIYAVLLAVLVLSIIAAAKE